MCRRHRRRRRRGIRCAALREEIRFGHVVESAVGAQGEHQRQGVDDQQNPGHELGEQLAAAAR
ncbi:MAG: hypothetical protein ACK559_02105, partial [bacterium]